MYIYIYTYIYIYIYIYTHKTSMTGYTNKFGSAITNPPTLPVSLYNCESHTATLCSIPL